MRLTQNFTLEELTASQEAARRGIDNTPSGEVVVNLTKLAHLLEEIRALFSGRAIIVSSGYRSPAVNKAVGGSDTSAHMKGLAADFICPTYGNPLAVARAIVGSKIVYGQIIHEYGRWVHVSIGKAALPILTIDSKGTREGLWEAR